MYSYLPLEPKVNNCWSHVDWKAKKILLSKQTGWTQGSHHSQWWSFNFCFYGKTLWPKATEEKKGFKLALRLQSVIERNQSSINHGIMLLAGSLVFLYNLEPPVQGIVLPTVDWALLCQLTFKQIPHRLTHKPIWSK